MCRSQIFWGPPTVYYLGGSRRIGFLKYWLHTWLNFSLKILVRVLGWYRQSNQCRQSVEGDWDGRDWAKTREISSIWTKPTPLTSSARPEVTQFPLYFCFMIGTCDSVCGDTILEYCSLRRFVFESRNFGWDDKHWRLCWRDRRSVLDGSFWTWLAFVTRFVFSDFKHNFGLRPSSESPPGTPSTVGHKLRVVACKCQVSVLSNFSLRNTLEFVESIAQYAR